MRSADPGDDYLIALASAHRAALVSGDKHLLSLSSKIPVFSPRDFLELLVGLIQAFVFMLLCAVYIQLSTTHEEENAHEH